MQAPTQSSLQELDTNNNITDEISPTKRKRFLPEQLNYLISVFEHTTTPPFEVREELAEKLGMTNREVQVWFQNRRAKVNRQKNNNTIRFLHHPSMNIPNDQPASCNQEQVKPTQAGFQFVPMVVDRTSEIEKFAPKPAFSKRFERKAIAVPASIKVMPLVPEQELFSQNYAPKTAPPYQVGYNNAYTYAQTYTPYEHRSYGIQPKSATLPNFGDVSPLSPNLLTPLSANSIDVLPEMVDINRKSHSTTTLPSLKELGLALPKCYSPQFNREF